MLNAWGEPLIKRFVQESITHAVRLEQALTKLQTERRIVMLHYPPIRATLQGEDPEIFAFLGSSRLEEPINRFRVTAVLHGHAHNGIPDGKTSTGIPVYNVSAARASQIRKGLSNRRIVVASVLVGFADEFFLSGTEIRPGCDVSNCTEWLVSANLPSVPYTPYPIDRRRVPWTSVLS